MNDQQLKMYLSNLVQNNKDIEKEQSHTVLKAMLEYIGTPDSELRDKLIYRTFFFSITKGIFTVEQLKATLDTVLSKDYLFYEVGSAENDTVFTRSFSSLVIAVILHHNLTHSFLDASTIIKIKDALIKYTESECDVRGYVHDKGWAHSVAHVADAIDELAKHSQLSYDDFVKLFKVVLTKAIYQATVYQSDESERLVTAAVTILPSLDNDTILSLIHEIQIKVVDEYRTLPSDLGFNQTINWKQFLTALYFRLNKLELSPNILATVEKYIYELTKPYYHN
ncbi:DUF2785 domain-containing protein [Bacillus suaedaesalsae]|uniref:DUF2785 domain-containing protein n=1 Tax=Bacillus suaedaesalsae TaxID=2810349 RepID=A0ABS2DI26_9BACI|nr:DUF2785 domain-containing protein [Bacillus suaedaesalsae]MBM6618141.1 DUF2785 domain-containing protein [Bacillus suaedaesalsae]